MTVLRGYAPGNYMCKCLLCDKGFQGDKRASECFECAVTMTRDSIDQRIATARLEGEAKGRERGLDEAANEMEIWFDNFMRQSHGAFQSPKDAILALKEKPDADPS